MKLTGVDNTGSHYMTKRLKRLSTVKQAIIMHLDVVQDGAIMQSAHILSITDNVGTLHVRVPRPYMTVELYHSCRSAWEFVGEDPDHVVFIDSGGIQIDTRIFK